MGASTRLSVPPNFRWYVESCNCYSLLRSSPALNQSRPAGQPEPLEPLYGGASSMQTIVPGRHRCSDTCLVAMASSFLSTIPELLPRKFHFAMSPDRGKYRQRASPHTTLATTTITVQLTAVHFFILMIDSASISSAPHSLLRWNIITRPLHPNTSPLTEARL